MNCADFRTRFPLLGRRVYVNSCSQGALSIDVDDAVRAFLDSWHESGSPWERWIEEVERLRTTFAASIGADRDEIAVMPTATAGINAVASALDFSGSRKQVVLGEFEFPTMAQPWWAQAPRGATVRWAKADGDELSTDAYAAVIDEHTLIVPATHVCFRNGHKTDIASLTRLCHDRGAYVFLDDYQRTGSGPIDVHALGVDFMVTGCLKYLLAAAGVAFLYVRRDLIERFRPTVTGWFGRVNPFAYRIDAVDWPETATRFEGGTPPVLSAWAAQAALGLINRLGLEPVGAEVARLVARFHALASDAGFHVRTPSDPDRRGPLVVLESTDSVALVANLAERGIITSARGPGLRVSFHAYNNDADIDAVMGALEKESHLLVRRPMASLQPHSR
jgi:selenocysteine lyase/cysteine desulfurase